MIKSIECLVQELATDIENYPETSKDIISKGAILSKAKNIDKSIEHGKKWGYKKILMELLGYNHQRVGGSFQTISGCILFLYDLGVKDIGEALIGFPAILDYKVKSNLEPTGKFLENNCYITIEDIAKNLLLLKPSLEKKIKPRYAFLETKGLDNEYPAKKILISNDKQFCELLGVDLGEYKRFKKDYLNLNQQKLNIK